MKIIAKDNFDRDWVSEHVIAENVNEGYAKLIVKLLNRDSGENSAWFYRAEPDDYVPYKFEV